MKKSVKVILVVVGILFSSVIIDLISIFTISKPVFAIKTDKGDSINIVYKGLLFDTYNCLENSIPQIKLKGTKFSCAVEIKYSGKVKEIIDTTNEIKDFSCAEMLEQFYEDDSYLYFYPCLKSNYIVVRYENGYEETVSNALKNGSIKIEDLDLYNIRYYKENK